MNWIFICQSNLSPEDKWLIAKLKDQHWQYGIDSQLEWMDNNLLPDDIHLLGKEGSGDNEYLQAYMSLSQIEVNIDTKEENCLGIGNVCVDRVVQNRGIGRDLVLKSMEYINMQRKQGILLCKDKLVAFYKKCGWHMLQYQEAIVSNRPYTFEIMTINKMFPCKEIDINRNF